MVSTKGIGLYWAGYCHIYTRTLQEVFHMGWQGGHNYVKVRMDTENWTIWMTGACRIGSNARCFQSTMGLPNLLLFWNVHVVLWVMTKINVLQYRDTSSIKIQPKVSVTTAFTKLPVCVCCFFNHNSAFLSVFHLKKISQFLFFFTLQIKDLPHTIQSYWESFEAPSLHITHISYIRRSG